MLHASHTVPADLLGWLRDEAELRCTSSSALVRSLIRAARQQVADGAEPLGWPAAIVIRGRDEPIAQRSHDRPPVKRVRKRERERPFQFT